MFKIGCHLSASKGYTDMAEVSHQIGANTFQFFTRNPRGGKAKDIDEKDINELLKIMKENNFGRIVNTASGSGIVAAKGSALYTAVKHAVVGLTKAAALDYATQNITINAVAPGTIETELIQKYKDTPDYQEWCKSNPAGRLGKPYEIGRVVAFLFEDNSSFINGVVLPIDSGFCAGRF